MRSVVSLSAALLLAGLGGAVAQAEVAQIEPAALRVEIRTAAGELPGLPAGCRLTATEISSSPRSVEVALAEAAAEVALPGAATWRLCLEAAGLWAGCQQVKAPGAASKAVVLTAWPAAALTGRVRVADCEGGGKPGADAVELPSAFMVTVGPPPGPGVESGLKEAAFPCPIDPQGRFSCSVPATPLYAALRASGFVSRYFWDLEPLPGRPLPLGTVVLQRGASLSGAVALDAEGVDAGKISVRLAPVVGPGTAPAAAARLEAAAPRSRVDPHGFFQFAAIPPGAYMLEVAHPGFATSYAGPVEVYPGKETELRFPVELLPPIRLELAIQPPSAPSGQPWTVAVFRARSWSAGSDLVFRGEADEAGGLQLPGQSPGAFEISISDSAGNRFHRSTLQVEPGDPGFVPITIPLVAVQGALRLGDEPVAGTLVFGGRHGAVRSRMASDEHGRFRGVLSRQGDWEVEVEISDPPIRTVTRVEVAAGRDGTAKVLVELPDTELIGRVIDGEGMPVANAEVRVESLGELRVHRSDETDERGEFHFRALPAGAAAVTARHSASGQRRVSPPARVSLQDEVVTGPVEIVLQAMVQVAGRVVSATGPAPGARVHAARWGCPFPRWPRR